MSDLVSTQMGVCKGRLIPVAILFLYTHNVLTNVKTMQINSNLMQSAHAQMAKDSREHVNKYNNSMSAASCKFIHIYAP